MADSPFKQKVFFIFLKLFLAIHFLTGIYPDEINAQTGILPLRNYTQKEFTPPGNSTGTQNWKFIQDEKGLLYVGNGGGILIYDGSNWEMIPSRDGATVNTFEKDSTGRIWYGTNNEFGFLEKDSTGRFSMHDVTKDFPEIFNKKLITDLYEIHATRDGIYFHTSDCIYFLKDKNFTLYKPNTAFNYSFKIDNRVYVQSSKVGLGFLENGKLVLLPEGGQFGSQPIFAMFKWGEGSLMIGTRKSGFTLYSQQKYEPFNINFETELLNAVPYRSILLKDGNVAIATIHGGIFIMDRKGNLLYQMDKTHGMQDDLVITLFEDNHGGIWAGLDEGITRITYPSPLSYYNSFSGVDCAIESTFENDSIMYLATSKGLYYLDRRKPGDRFIFLSGYDIQCWNFAKSGNRIFLSTTQGIYEIRGTRLLPLSGLREVSLFYIHISSRKPDKIYCGYKNGLALFNLKSKEFEKVPDLKATIRTISEGKDGIIWLGSTNGGTFKVNQDLSFIQFDTASGLPPGTIRAFEIDDKPVFGTDKGLFAFDPLKNFFFPDSSFGKQFILPENDIFRIKKDPSGKIWYNSGNRIGYVINSGSEFLNKEVPFKNTGEQQINNLYFENGIVWLGGIEKLIRFNEKIQKNHDLKYYVSVQRITTIKDSMIFYRDEFLPGFSSTILPFEFNSLTFHFSGLWYENPEACLFSFKLENFDEDWSSWSKEKWKQYTNLPPGKYSFLLKSKNVYGAESFIKKISFTILPPWYRTVWAYLFYLTSFFFLILLIFKVYTKRLRIQNLILEQKVKDRTLEIENKKEKLEIAYKEIEEKNKEITDSISYAKRIQESIFQPLDGLNNYFEGSFIFFQPKDIVSGDFYWYSAPEIQDSNSEINGKNDNSENLGGHLFIVAADCTGHGVPGAFMSMIGNDLLNQAINDLKIYETSKILKFMDLQIKRVLRQTSDEFEVSEGIDLALCHFDFAKNTLEFSGAQRPLFHIRNGVLNEFPGSRCSLGGFTEKNKNFENHLIRFEKGDCFYFFSDGIVDQFGHETNKKYTSKRLKETLTSIHKQPMIEQQEILSKQFSEWKGELRQIDDVLLIGVCI